jgi:hypothetical protein
MQRTLLDGSGGVVERVPLEAAFRRDVVRPRPVLGVRV